MRRGQRVAVTGRSGSGKSTLLNLITGIDRPTGGTVLLDGVSPAALAERELARWRGRTVGVVFQCFQLLPTLTVLENVVLPMDLCGVHPRRERRERARALLERVVGELAFRTPLPLAISGTGVALWLVLLAVGTALATAVPARRASRLTVREAIA